MVARLAAGILFIGAAVTGLAGIATAAGNNGTVKLGSAGIPFTNSNDPHLTCPIQIQWSGFDAGGQTYDVTFTGINPTGGTVTPASDHGTFTDGSVTNTRTYSLTFAGATPNNKGEYHVGIDINTTSASGSDFKQKTIWVQGCAGGSVAVQGQCNNTRTGYNWTVTATPTQPGSDATVAGTWAKQSDATVNGAFSTNSAGAGSFSTPVGANALNLTITTANWTGPATATATACAAPPSALQLTAACSAPGSGTVLWTVTNPNAVQVTGVSADPAANVANGPAATIAANGTTTFTTPAPSVSRVAHGSVGADDVTSNSLAFSGACAPGQVETPASIDFSSTCDGIHAVFTSADLHSTHFVVSAPDGSTDTFNGDATKDYAATTGAGHLSVTFDGTSDSYDWQDPGDAICNPVQPQADPTFSADKACKTGISVVLGNVNGTADVTFTVTDPDGNVHKVPVRAGQIKKESYAVTEDTTGVVTVTAPGLAKKTVSYAKDCSTVLGVRHVRHPHTVVLGEKNTRTPEQLPFTGYDPRSSLFLAALLLMFGGFLCSAATIRRRPTD